MNKSGHVAKKLPQAVAYHHDDSGEDFGPLGDDSHHAGEKPSSEDGETLNSASEEETCCMHVSDLGMTGSEFIPETQQDHSLASAMDFEGLESFMAWNS